MAATLPGIVSRTPRHAPNAHRPRRNSAPHTGTRRGSNPAKPPAAVASPLPPTTRPALRESHAQGYRYGAWIPLLLARQYAEIEVRDSSLVWLEEALDARWGERPGLSSDTAFAFLRDDPRFRELAGGFPPEVTGRNEGWRRDLDYLVEEAHRLHVSPAGEPAVPAAFDSAARRLRPRIPELSNDEILAELRMLVVTLGDGHSTIYGPDDSTPLDFRAETLPFLFYLFDDGLYVIDAAEGHERWIGSEVLAFGDVPSGKVLERLPTHVIHDNPMTVRWLGVRFVLPHLSFLQAIGAADSFTAVDVTLSRPDGRKHRLTFRGGPHLQGFQRKLRPPPGLEAEPPLFLRRVDDNYWLRPLPEADALYFQFNQVRNEDGGPTLAQFADSLRRALTGSEATSLVVDVRHNNGGNNGLLRPLIRTMVWWEQDGPGRRIFVITGRNTFSAAQNFVSRAERWTDAVFVGEPSSSRPNFVGEGTNLLLPYSRVRGSISNRYWQDSDPDDRRRWIAPDMPVGLTSEDYFGGRDPALQAILAVLERRR